MDSVINQGESIAQQLEEEDPSESLRIQAEIETLKVAFSAIYTNTITLYSIDTHFDTSTTDSF